MFVEGRCAGDIKRVVIDCCGFCFPSSREQLIAVVKFVEEISLVLISSRGGRLSDGR